MIRSALVLCTLAIATPQASADDGTVRALGAPSSKAAATARCIARRLPRGGQFFMVDDGGFRVVSIGPRGKTAEWTVRPGKAGPVVTRQGGPAGIERGVKGACY